MIKRTKAKCYVYQTSELNPWRGLAPVSKGGVLSQPSLQASVHTGLGSQWILINCYFKEVSLNRNTKHSFAKTPNTSRMAATMSCASLQNPLDLTPIQDKIHKYFPEKTWLTTYSIHKFSPSNRHFFVSSHITQHTNSALWNKAPNFSPKKATDRYKTVTTNAALNLREFHKN